MSQGRNPGKLMAECRGFARLKRLVARSSSRARVTIVGHNRIYFEQKNLFGVQPAHKCAYKPADEGPHLAIRPFRQQPPEHGGGGSICLLTQLGSARLPQNGVETFFAAIVAQHEGTAASRRRDTDSDMGDAWYWRCGFNQPRRERTSSSESFTLSAIRALLSMRRNFGPSSIAWNTVRRIDLTHGDAIYRTPICSH